MFPVFSERFQISNKVLLVVADACLMLLSITLAAVLPSTGDGASWHRLLQRDMLSKFFFVIAIFTVGLQYSRLYSFALTTKRRELLVRCFRGVGFAYIALALLYARYPHFSLGGAKTGIAVTLIVLSVLGWRLALGSMRVVKDRIEKVLVLGTGGVGREIQNTIRSADDLDMEIVGFLDEDNSKSGLHRSDPGVIGHLADVERIVRREKIDRIVLSVGERRGRMPLNQLLRLKLAGVKVEDAHSMYERLTGRIRLEDLSPSWLFMSRGFRNAGIKLLTKYIFDLLVSSILLALFSPAMIIVALAIWIETGQPILFVQDRVGRHGKLFRMYKFRSMHVSSETSEARWVTDEEHRITGVGRFIRRYRLDEFPQLFNVLRGEMSLVGPRPEQPYFCQILGNQVPYFTERHSVRPGITGWAQVKFQYGASIDDSKTKLEYDLFYLKHMSPLLDMVILFGTVSVLLFGKGAK